MKNYKIDIKAWLLKSQFSVVSFKQFQLFSEIISVQTGRILGVTFYVKQNVKPNNYFITRKDTIFLFNIIFIIYFSEKIPPESV